MVNISSLLKALPPVPKTGDKETIALLQALRQLAMVREGIGHDNLDDMGVSFSDLKSYHHGYTFSGQFSDGPRVYAKDVPKPPTDINATAIGVTSRRITWTWPIDSKPLDAVEVWLSSTSSRSAAQRIAIITWPVAEYTRGGFPADTAAYFWIRIIRGGKYSPWEPSDAMGGFVVVPVDVPTVNDLMNGLTQMDRYSTSYKMVLDAFQILQPSGSIPAWAAGSYDKYSKVKHNLPGPGYSYYQSLINGNTDEPPSGNWMNIDAAVDLPVPTFTIGNIDGIPTVGVHGDMIVDGSLLTRHLSATEIYTATIASNDYVQNEAGWKIDAANGIAEFNDVSLIVRNSATDDYAKLSEGDLEFYFKSGTTYYPYKSVKKILPGTASNGVLFTIPGYWRTAPTIFPTVNSIALYDASYPAADQKMEISVDDPVEVSTGRWQTTIYAELLLGTYTFTKTWSNETADALGYPVGTWVYDTDQTTTYTTPSNVVSVTVSCSLEWTRAAIIGVYGTASIEVYFYINSTKYTLYAASVSLAGAGSTINKNLSKTVTFTDLDAGEITVYVKAGARTTSGGYFYVQSIGVLSSIKATGKIGSSATLAAGKVNYIAFGED